MTWWLHLHRGDAELGHYQALLRTGEHSYPEDFPAALRAPWLLTDDGMMTRVTMGWPQWAASRINVLWLTGQAKLSLPEAPLPQMLSNDRERMLDLLA